MLLTVAHQSRSPTFRCGSTTVPIEQSVPPSKFYSDEGSDIAADMSVFCIIKMFLGRNSEIHSIVRTVQLWQTLSACTVIEETSGFSL